MDNLAPLSLVTWHLSAWFRNPQQTTSSQGLRAFQRKLGHPTTIDVLTKTNPPAARPNQG